MIATDTLTLTFIDKLVTIIIIIITIITITSIIATETLNDTGSLSTPARHDACSLGPINYAIIISVINYQLQLVINYKFNYN